MTQARPTQVGALRIDRIVEMELPFKVQTELSRRPVAVQGYVESAARAYRFRDI